METTRFILVLALSFVLVMLWQAWQEDYGVKQEVTQNPDQEVTGEDVPAVTQDLTRTDTTPVIEESTHPGEIITVTTDTLHLEINTIGGTIRMVELLKYPASLEDQDIPVKLLYDTPDNKYLVQGGLLAATDAPTHEAQYVAQQDNYVMGENDNFLNVPLTWISASGVRVTKTFRFNKGEHLINVRYLVENNSEAEWKGRAYGQIQRNKPETSMVRTVYTYTGAVLSTPDHPYEKIDFEDMQEKKLELDSTGGWIAMLQHYFVTAIVPADQAALHHYYTLALQNDRYAIGAITRARQIPAGQTDEFELKLYIGPKVQKDLEKVAPNLQLTVDYGSLWFIAKPLFWCLEKFHSLAGNWGWAIILVTLMLKIVFYKLSAAGYMSMANMRKVQPRIMAIRDRYKNDRARLNQAMMDIYKKEKINPLGGCFPILVQIPVFISLYWVLLESVELRQTPFILWIKDLSGPDPYFVLPVVMGITMLIQQKLNPAPMDPVQEKIMMLLPFIFTIFFAFFPSGLVLYWVVNNILSIAQQWLITRNIEKAATHPQ